MRNWAALTALALSVSLAGRAESAPQKNPIPVALPAGEAGIGFDDLGFAPHLRRVLVPSGRTGNLYLINPDTLEITAVSGFSASDSYSGGHSHGITSADECGRFLVVTDRTQKTVVLADPANRQIAAAPLASSPDYVRCVSETGEIWVTEPDNDRIEIFGLSMNPRPSLRHRAFLAVPGGPESLVIDHTRRKAYCHLWAGETVVIDIKARALVAAWKNGCEGSRGIALDEQKGFLFVGCKEGKVSVLDAGRGGKLLADFSQGAGVDIIAYNPALSHLYLPGAGSGTMAVLAVSPEGKLSLVRTLPTVQGAHCVTADDRGNIWVCDPDHGRLLLFKDGPTAG